MEDNLQKQAIRCVKPQVPALHARARAAPLSRWAKDRAGAVVAVLTPVLHRTSVLFARARGNTTVQGPDVAAALHLLGLPPVDPEAIAEASKEKKTSRRFNRAAYEAQKAKKLATVAASESPKKTTTKKKAAAAAAAAVSSPAPKKQQQKKKKRAQEEEEEEEDVDEEEEEEEQSAPAAAMSSPVKKRARKTE